MTRQSHEAPRQDEYGRGDNEDLAVRTAAATAFAAGARALGLVVLPLFVLNLLLTFGNEWPTLWPRLEWRLSTELAALLVALAIWIGWRGALGQRMLGALAALGSTWVVMHYINVTVPSIFGRRLNAYWDSQHLWAVIKMSVENKAFATALTLIVAGLALALLYAIVRLCMLPLVRAAEHDLTRRLLLFLGLAVCALSVAQPWQPERLRPLLAPPVSALLAEQSRLLVLALSADAQGGGLGPGPVFSGTVDALGGADVLIVFAEAYGAITFDKPDIAEALAPSRAQLAAAIAAGDRHVVSARLVAPTFGGASWLSHASLLAGVDTRDPRDYQQLLASSRPSLVSHFAANGYRSVGWLPGIQRAWPEGAFYAFDRYADAERIGYEGPHFGFWRIPDQASMALIHHQEFGKDFSALPASQQEAGPRHRQPRLVVFPTVTTHAPFRALPPFTADWSRLLGADAYTIDERDAAEGVAVAWSNPTPAYLASMRYQFDWLADYLGRHAPADLFTIIVGDHQPIGSVTGPNQPWDVPIHIVSHNRRLLAHFEAAGFVPGLVPPATPFGPMHAITPLLIEAFASAP